MLDIKHIRDDTAAIEKKLQTKDPKISLAPLIELDLEVRRLKTEGEALKSQQNRLSKEIGLKKRDGGDASALLAEAEGLGRRIAEIDRELPALEERFLHTLSCLPNIPQEGIRVSESPADNVEIRRFGEKRAFDFPFKNHLELGDSLKLFDFERATKLSGSFWPAYRGLGARLEWALIQYMISIQLKNGFEQWLPPLLVREEMMFGSGMLPKFADQVFRVKDEDFNLYLIPTAEVALNGLHYDEILDGSELPKLYTAYTPCFRREAGAAGKTERGLIRTHQFNKVEMFAFAKPEESEAIFEKMLRSAEEVLQGLELHYRSMLLVTGDMSFASSKTVDIEVWLPGQDRYYEVSSVSHCTDYQARRSRIRFRREKGGKPEFLHTLNGSGLATSRLMVSLLENNQNRDGSITIPKVLQPFLGGLKELTGDLVVL